MASSTHYEVLEVARTAGVDTIRAAHAFLRAQVKAIGDTPAARERLRDLDAAFVVLSDPHLRQRYDAELAAAAATAAGLGAGPAPAPLDDMFAGETNERPAEPAPLDERTERERALAYLKRPRADLAREAALVSDWAGFWRRLGAGWVDSVVLYVPYVVAAGGAMAIGTALGAEGGAVFVAMLAMLAVMLVYHALFVASGKVATPGRMALGIAVVDVDTGVPLGLGRAVARSLLSAIGYVLIVPNMFALFTARKQSVADLATNSAVVVYRPGGGAGIAAAVIVAMFVVIGVLAAIAIPQYQDYLMRARLIDVRRDLDDYAQQVERHLRTTGRVPARLEALPERQARYATYSVLANGTVVADVTDRGTAYGQLALRPQYFKERDEIRWVCVSDGMRGGVRPRDCPQGEVKK